MKLIIEIDEEDYNDIITCNPEVETEYVLDLLMKCVENGIPLDDIRAEIKKKRDEVANVLTFDNTAYEKYQTMMDTYDECLAIIDKAVQI